MMWSKKKVKEEKFSALQSLSALNVEEGKRGGWTGKEHHSPPTFSCAGEKCAHFHEEKNFFNVIDSDLDL